MQDAWKWANRTLAFGMGLVALGALGLWGWKTATVTSVKLASAVGVPLLAALARGLFAAPAAFDNPLLAAVTKVVVFGGAAVGLRVSSYRAVAVVFLVVVTRLE